MLGDDAGIHAKQRPAGMQCHHHFFERGVARALADAVDRALHLARAGADGGQAVRHGHAEVVMAMRREHDLVRPAHVLAQVLEHFADFGGGDITDGVGRVEYAGAGFDGDREDLGEVFRFGAQGVFGGEFDFVGEGLGPAISRRRRYR